MGCIGLIQIIMVLIPHHLVHSVQCEAPVGVYFSESIVFFVKNDQNDINFALGGDLDTLLD